VQLTTTRSIAISAPLLVVVGAADYLNGYEISLAPLYLVPILLVTWKADMAWGITFVLASSAVPFLTGIFAGHPYSRPLYFYLDVGNWLISFLAITIITSRLKQAYDREKTVARTDFLTNIANRAAFFEFVLLEIERQRRYGRPFTLIYVDCDDFKAINDKSGHKMGDNLLRTVAQTLKASVVRKTDLVARLGGDEFAVLLPETETCSVIVKNIEHRLRAAMRKNRWPVTFSAGVVVFKHAPDSVDQAVETADALMYRVKKSGKNAVLQEVF